MNHYLVTAGISKVSDQNGISRLYVIVEIHHSGRKSSIYMYSKMMNTTKDNCTCIHKKYCMIMWQDVGQENKNEDLYNNLLDQCVYFRSGGKMLLKKNLRTFEIIHWISMCKKNCRHQFQYSKSFKGICQYIFMSL